MMVARSGSGTDASECQALAGESASAPQSAPLVRSTRKFSEDFAVVRSCPLRLDLLSHPARHPKLQEKTNSLGFFMRRRSGLLVHSFKDGFTSNKPELGWRIKTRRERSIPLVPELVAVLTKVIDRCFMRRLRTRFRRCWPA